MTNHIGNSGPGSSAPDFDTNTAVSERSYLAPKRRWLASGFVAILLASFVAACGDLPDTDEPESAQIASETSETSASDEPVEEASAKPKEEKKAENKPSMTSGQENAVRAAENYISFMPFSKQGLIEQLSSDFGDGYSVKDATFAVDHITVDWNEQAAKAAENYLDMMPFSKSGLIEQLTSEHGDGYTRKQAEYGVKKAGL